MRKSTGGVQIITNITPITGTFYSKNTQQLANSSMTRIQKVSFPFQAIFYLSTGDNVEILFNEKADYDVEINIL